MRAAITALQAAVVLASVIGVGSVAAAPGPKSGPDRSDRCRGVVYLTLDTGNMRHAEDIAAMLARHRVKATFFVANEATPAGEGALEPRWAPFWQRLAAAGHAFGSHTFDHVRFRSLPEGQRDAQAAAGKAITLARPEFGPNAGRAAAWGPAEVCAELDRADQRFRELTGRPLQRLWRAPSGRAPDTVFDAARACGWRHAGWTTAGFLGDELPSERFPNESLLAQAIRSIGDGDVLMAHLGIRSRQDPYAPMLDRLLPALAARGLCFATLDAHPAAQDGRHLPLPRPGARPAPAPGIGPQHSRPG